MRQNSRSMQHAARSTQRTDDNLGLLLGGRPLWRCLRLAGACTDNDASIPSESSAGQNRTQIKTHNQLCVGVMQPDDNRTGHGELRGLLC